MTIIVLPLVMCVCVQLTAGSYCTYAVKFDGSVASVGEGSYGRLGHAQSDNERRLKNIESLQGTL